MSGGPWSDGEAYDGYVGRWSRRVAPLFLEWADLPRRATALDLGCGTGSLSAALLGAGALEVVGVDRSPAYLRTARLAVPGRGASFAVGDGAALCVRDAAFDCAVSGLVLNFIPEPLRAVREMARVVRPGGTVAAYVWDYGGRMEVMRHFWQAAVELDPQGAGRLAEDRRFSLCSPPALLDLFTRAGLADVSGGRVEAVARFRDFEDYWRPFTAGQGPAGAYLAGLDEGARGRLAEALRARLVGGPDGAISLPAGALTVRGVRP